MRQKINAKPTIFSSYETRNSPLAFIPWSRTDQGMKAMQQFSSGTRQQLPPQLFEQMGHFRREVFINRLGWRLNTVNGMELDEFDGPDALYVCSHDDQGNVNGVARLLPTTAPYLMEKVFPHLWAGKELPHDPQVWELSRFAAVDFNVDSSLAHQCMARHAPKLFRLVIETIKRHAVQKLITVSPIGMERLLRAHGFYANRAGIPTNFEGVPIVALRIGIF